MAYRKDLLEKAYLRMKTIRVFEERCIAEFQQGNIPGFVHASNGQEAAAVASCIDLTNQDIIGSTHRGHGHCIAKGCDVSDMMKEIMGRVTGLCKGKGGSMHIADIDKGNVALSFGGDGSANQGTVLEAMNLAVVLQLPHIFFFENNGYAEGTGADYGLGCDDLTSRNAGFGMPSEKVNGIDFFETYDAVKRAIKHARQGKGPTAIEAMCVRFDGHFIGDPQLYRGTNEIKEDKKNKDCLTHFIDRVTSENWLKQSFIDAIDEDVSKLINTAVTDAMAAPHPDPSVDLLADVYNTY